MHKLGNGSMTANDKRNEIKAVLTARRNLYNAGVALLESDFFSTPIANQKKARYNMTRRTEMVIFQGGCGLGFYRLRD